MRTPFNLIFPMSIFSVLTVKLQLYGCARRWFILSLIKAWKDDLKEIINMLLLQLSERSSSRTFYVKDVKEKKIDQEAIKQYSEPIKHLRWSF